jgi:hypothetical protein
VLETIIPAIAVEQAPQACRWKYRDALAPRASQPSTAVTDCGIVEIPEGVEVGHVRPGAWGRLAGCSDR